MIRYSEQDCYFINHLLKNLSDYVFWKDKNLVFKGCNQSFSEQFGYSSPQDIIGKSDYDFPWTQQLRGKYINDDKQILSSGQAKLNYEEEQKQADGTIKTVLVSKIPVYDDKNAIIGILGIYSDITDRKNAERLTLENERQKLELEAQAKFKRIIDQAAHDNQSPLTALLVIANQCSWQEKEDVFDALDKIAEATMIPLYWFNENNIFLGNNNLDLLGIGGKNKTDFIGKTQYDYLPYETAENIVQHNNLVMRIGKILSQDSSFNDLTTGKLKHFSTFKAPLYDNNGKIIGILCTSIDNTILKEAEILKQQTEKQEVIIAEQNRFKKIADQVVHDIRSPLASLSMMLKTYEKDIPEQIRVPLRDAAANINDIANHLLSRYERDDPTTARVEEQQLAMIFLILSQVLSDETYQHKEKNIKFISDCDQKCMFAFIKTQPSSLKRILYNLINNAVEALEEQPGTINLALSMDDDDKIKIVVQDSGKGMSKEMVNRILSNKSIKTDKKGGYGIGLTQIRETLERNQGKLAVESEPGKGTKMTITFPSIEPPEWITKELKINKQDIIVILDDDKSICGAWDSRFKKYLNEIQVKHFLAGNQAIEFINSSPDKEKILLLTDYELLKQGVNGIDIIQQTNIKRTILVTSHHTKTELRNTAANLGIKILPKQLVSNIPIKVCENISLDSNNKKTKKKTGFVIIDDDDLLRSSVVLLVESHNKLIDEYSNPKVFLNKISQYSKNTKILMDNSFGTNSISGIELAQQLHKQGFTNLYLFSGKNFETEKIPGYLTVILKTDIGTLHKIIQ